MVEIGPQPACLGLSRTVRNGRCASRPGMRPLLWSIAGAILCLTHGP